MNSTRLGGPLADSKARRAEKRGFVRKFIGSIAEANEKAKAAQAAKDARIVCPHCQKPGGVSTKPVTKKKGVDGNKAALGVVTFGASAVVTGIGRTEKSTKLHCSNCNMTWTAAR